MKNRFWQVVITHKEHFDNEIQIDFRTRWGAMRFIKKHLSFQFDDDWEIYINLVNLRKDYFGKQVRLA